MAKQIKKPRVTNTMPLADRLNEGAIGTGRAMTEPDEVDPNEEPLQPTLATTVDDSASDTPVVTETEPEAVVDAPQEAVDATGTGPWMDAPNRPRDGVIVGPGEDIRVNGVVQGSQVILSQRIYRAFRPMGAVDRWGFKLLYPANVRIPMTKVTQVNGQPVESGVVTLPERLSAGETVTLPRSA